MSVPEEIQTFEEYWEWYKAMNSDFGARRLFVESLARPRPTPRIYHYETGFEHVKFFLYDSLKCPKVLREALQLDHDPVLFPASARIIYKVSGMVYEVTEEEHLKRLTEINGPRYKIRFVLAVSDIPGDEYAPVFGASTLIWNGDYSELTDE
ncbi:hypothetical protein ABW20_dc0103334 [Dactylellina cionopaga]|nr:hypothetical protein ABW20_dc0103334 [Dactylellina cionopaga]